MRRLKMFFFILVAGIAFAAVSALVMDGAGGISAFRPQIDLYADDTDYTKLTKIDHLYAEFDISLGCFVEEETTHTNRTTGRVESKFTRYYYAVPAYSGEDTYWIGVELILEDDMKTMDQVTEETYAYLMADEDAWGYTYLQKHGSLKKLGKEKYEYMVQMFQEMGVYESDEELKQHVLPVYISTYQPEAMREEFIVAVVALLVCIVIFALTIRSVVQKHKKKPAISGDDGISAQSAYTQNTYTASNSGGETLIELFGANYPKRFLYRVNNYMENNQPEEAKQELRAVTGLSLYQAEEVIAHWRDYYK